MDLLTGFKERDKGKFVKVAGLLRNCCGKTENRRIVARGQGPNGEAILERCVVCGRKHITYGPAPMSLLAGM